MTRRRLLLSLFLLLLLGAVAGAAGVWYFFFSGQAPAVATIDEAANSVSSTANPSASLDGAWQVDTAIGNFSDYSSRYAGFRINEVLSGIGESTAIGRTPDVTGELTLAGKSLTTARIEVQLTSITSDRPRRDPAIQQALETSTYPTPTFELTDPIDLPSAPAEGVTYDVTAPGTLTIHGVAKPVDIALQARLVNGVIVVVGSADLTFSDYGVTMPRAPIVLSVEDNGRIEFQLFFTRSG